MAKEYIERETALTLCQDFIDSHEDGSWRWVNAITDKDIMNIPAADVVEVVRCKNCKHVNDGYRNVNILLCRKFYETPVSGNDYCRWGEPKDTTSADSEPVKHGEWFGTVCSACGESTSFYYDCDYCPRCGAKMEPGITE